MSWTLLTNDDGHDSPALVPFAEALGRERTVRVVVPDVERSWSGKAITRFDPIHVTPLDGGLDGWSHSGMPADGVQLGAHSLFDAPPDLVVSGINVGYNHGAGYVWSSGTVGAAVEAWSAGLPAVAFSTGAMHDWEAWRTHALSPLARPDWQRLADVCASILDELLISGFHEAYDVVNVNVPFDAGPATERRLTSLAPTGYGRLFAAVGERRFAHAYDGSLVAFGSTEGSDVEAAIDEVISITLMRLGDLGRLGPPMGG